MTFFGCIVLIVNLLSLYIGYRIFDKIRKKRSSVNGKGSSLEKGLVLFFLFLLVASVNSLTLVLSYTFFWEKAYRSITENHYEAVVTGYKKETVKTQHFRGSTYNNKTVYFPKVKYTDPNGNEISKTVDVTSNYPPSIGQKIKITDKAAGENANTLDINWIMFVFGSIFTGAATFFAVLLSTYITTYTLKRRMTLSLYAAFIMIAFNISCIVFILFSR